MLTWARAPRGSFPKKDVGVLYKVPGFWSPGPGFHSQSWCWWNSVAAPREAIHHEVSRIQVTVNMVPSRSQECLAASEEGSRLNIGWASGRVFLTMCLFSEQSKLLF